MLGLHKKQGTIMNIDTFSKIESSFFFVSFLSGVTVFIYLLFILSFYFNIQNINELLPLVSSNFGLISIFLLSYVIGMYIQGMRYVGFMYYKKIYDLRIQRIRKIMWRSAAKKYIRKYKQKKQFSKYSDFRKYFEFKKRSLLHKLIKYLFRNGTVVELCLTRAKETNCTYQWINETKKEHKDVIKTMWRLAANIDKEKDVYRFYFYSEIFQCYDTTFITLLCSQAIITITFAINSSNNFNKIFISSTMLAIFLCLHALSKNIGKAFADRFLNAIDTKRNLASSNKCNDESLP
jgi:hypothetical protein